MVISYKFSPDGRVLVCDNWREVLEFGVGAANLFSRFVCDGVRWIFLCETSENERARSWLFVLWFCFV